MIDVEYESSRLPRKWSLPMIRIHFGWIDRPDKGSWWIRGLRKGVMRDYYKIVDVGLYYFWIAIHQVRK